MVLDSSSGQGAPAEHQDSGENSNSTEGAPGDDLRSVRDVSGLVTGAALELVVRR
jgi:hypothetical protein